MNEEMSETTSQEEQGNKMNPIFIGIVILVIALVGFYALRQMGTDKAATTEDAAMMESTTTETDAMEQTTPAADEAMADQVEIDEDGVRVVEVEGGSFYYSPNEIRVKKNQPVRIVLNSVDMMHDFVIDELDVRSEVIKGGTSTTVEFTPDQAGEFEFYCSVGQHRANGMVGTLIVEE